jgi:hypothetical protein
LSYTRIGSRSSALATVPSPLSIKMWPPDCLWWAFLDTYRTLCLAPGPEIRDIFEQLREEPHLALLLTDHNDTA